MPRVLLTVLSYFHMTDFGRFIRHLTQPIQIPSGSKFLVFFFSPVFTRCSSPATERLLARKRRWCHQGAFTPPLGCWAVGRRSRWICIHSAAKDRELENTSLLPLRRLPDSSGCSPLQLRPLPPGGDLLDVGPYRDICLSNNTWATFLVSFLPAWLQLF